MKSSSYQLTRAGGGRIFVSSASLDALARLDCVVFDCDGTLIDVRGSYDATILRTAASLNKSYSGASLSLSEIGPKLILQVRRTGGFNSDWDTTYALTMFCAASVSGSEDSKTASVSKLIAIVDDFAAQERLRGWKSVDEYLVASGLESKSLDRLREFLGYPGSPPTSTLATAFDETYYGGDLYRSIYGVQPRSTHGKGLIEKERVMISKKTLEKIQGTLGGGTDNRRIAMATGRPFIAVDHTLGPLLDFFDRDASVYIGDGDIHPELAPRLSKFRKPSAESLALAQKVFNSSLMLYVGDSAEDRLMVENAAARDGKVLFAGIYGGSADEEAQISYFAGTASDFILKDVNQLAGVLEMAKKG